MTEKRPGDMTEPELESLFASARRTAPLPSGDMMARVLAGADEVLAAQRADPAPAPAPRQSWFAELLGAIGGWPGLAGLSVATVAGLAIGIALPETLGTVGGDVLTAALGYDIVDLMPSLGALIEEG